MTEQRPQTIYLKDYQPTPYSLEKVDLYFDLHDEETFVTSTLSFRRRGSLAQPLVLVGEDLELKSVQLNGKTLNPSEYSATKQELRIENVPAEFELKTQVRILPHLNKTLEGLYKSAKLFCTQCEAEGFRRITYFYDRPDVMAIYTTTLEADKTKYPVLLGNGNFVQKGDLAKGRHFVTWHDPFKKPSYLFAVVAGDLNVLRDEYVTKSGRKVALEIFAIEKDIPKCYHAMESLKQSMKWDEDVYGRECDLNCYMIVAVSDFNAGAMENKGLNIFNVSAVLASPEMAPDVSFGRVQGVVAHEYFHNWTGNRVTCRDWFQLCLKEGLTCFRDQEFSADLNSRPVKRISDVVMLRSSQFSEDAGPNAHPARPDKFIDISNFYTATVYEKGAEICRMLRILLGVDGFRKGTDLYFERHDGQAVTVEDFVAALADANGKDFSQFLQWYRQAGTPVVHVERRYVASQRTYTLVVSQKTNPTPDGSEKHALHMPMVTALLGGDGRELPLKLKGETKASGTERVLEIREARQEFVFEDVAAEPVPSLFRGFSAPINLELSYSDAELIFVMANDSDPFNRWEAGQKILSAKILALADDAKAGRELHIDNNILRALYASVQNKQLDDHFKSLMLTLPSVDVLMQKQSVMDVASLYTARKFVERKLAENFAGDMFELYGVLAASEPEKYQFEAKAVGRRTLKNKLLSYLCGIGGKRYWDLAAKQFYAARHMTDERAALAVLGSTESSERAPALDHYFKKWSHEELVVDSWFQIQTIADRENVLSDIRKLLAHPNFTLENPNRARSVLMALPALNPRAFHHPSGEGYAILAENVGKIAKLNPGVASRIAKEFGLWKKLEPVQREKCRVEIEKLSKQDLPKQVFEVVSNLLNR